jgi:hypothetical protein
VRRYAVVVRKLAQRLMQVRSLDGPTVERFLEQEGVRRSAQIGREFYFLERRGGRNIPTVTRPNPGRLSYAFERRIDGHVL